MKRRALIITAIVLAGAASAIYVVRRPAPDDHLVRISGNIEIDDVEVSFKLPGRVVQREVTEGQRIEAGQVVARLDDAELAREVEIRRAELGAARAVLTELERGYRREEIDQAGASLARARAEAHRTSSEHARQTALFERDVISEREYEAAVASYRMAVAQADEAEHRFSLLQRGPRQEQIDQARERVNQAAEGLALAETRLSFATLVSPLSGWVLTENVEAGEQVAAGTPVVTVGDLDHVWLRGYVDETDLGHVKLGQRVRVTTDTTGGKAYPGTVAFVASEAEFTPKSVQTEKERVKLVYRVKVDVSNPAGELKPGMPADAEIVLDDAEVSGR